MRTISIGFISSLLLRPPLGGEKVARQFFCFPYNSNMQEAAIGLIVLIVGIIIGAMLKPTEPMLAPLSPDDIRGNAAPEADSHHHH
jgi:hypothetical protein